MADHDHRIARKTSHREGRAHYLVTCSCGTQITDTDSLNAATIRAGEHLSAARQLETFSTAMQREEASQSSTATVEQEIEDHGIMWHRGCLTPPFLPDSYREMRAKYSADVVQHDYDLCHVWR